MGRLSIEQNKVLEALRCEGGATSLFIAKTLNGENRAKYWNVPRVGRIMQQLKYRSLVEFNGVTWRVREGTIIPSSLHYPY